MKARLIGGRSAGETVSIPVGNPRFIQVTTAETTAVGLCDDADARQYVTARTEVYRRWTLRLGGGPFCFDVYAEQSMTEAQVIAHCNQYSAEGQLDWDGRGHTMTIKLMEVP